MEKNVELLAVMVASISIIFSNYTSMQINKDLLRRLALGQKRLELTKNMTAVLSGRIADVEKYLTTHYGYQIRNSTDKITEQLEHDYENESTGF
ncbi:hypothetical protein [Microcoleus sp. bin38.metabat.b11b12b14.051]|uniref:hypothetical protein n=1 Tax=Microcoleus sp. bin38.metabat.b11b12b14.051 TaxID=2742709 RepID=UPI0025F6173F|nr:hypothetical protein [Microcoleus sp. bin38.metabat.b11b12b14.051]